jgi:hypothetical protein
MRSIRLDSSVLAKVDFAEETNVLEVEFRSGRIYRYYMVPAAVVDALLTATSAGQFFNAEVKDRYVCERVR